MFRNNIISTLMFAMVLGTKTVDENYLEKRIMDCDHRNHRVTKEDVISKLKDDGDFDKLRLSIIRKLKDHVNSSLAQGSELLSNCCINEFRRTY